MRNVIASLVFGAAMVLGCSAPQAMADPSPYDPHVPNFSVNNCEGGWGGFVVGFCDGTQYADGSYWHQTYYTSTMTSMGVNCVIDGGNPAPPGGCDGAV